MTPFGDNGPVARNPRSWPLTGKSVYTQRYERFRRQLVKARKDEDLTQDQVAGLLGRP